MQVVCGTRVAGPLEPFAVGFGGELARLGFTQHVAKQKMGLAAHLSRWMGQAGIEVADLTGDTVENFLSARRAAGYAMFHTAVALAPLLEYLCHLGVAPPSDASKPSSGCGHETLERYRRYLLAQRGVKPQTAERYVGLLWPFVDGHNVDGVAGFSGLTAGEVVGFLTEHSRVLSPKALQQVASALRSLLRFWYLDGVISEPLADAVPSVADRRPRLPRALPPSQVDALLESCDRGSAAGLRDAAILTLLCRLGLRVGEVAGLRLEDVDWRAGVVTIRGKGGRCDQLPLPVQVGERVAEYLRHGRPATALDRAVFVRVRAPHRGLSVGGVTEVVAAAARRAGLETVYGHRLRHSAATAMVGAGASLAEVGQVLRHRRAATTALYTKTDIAALRIVARPWPLAGV